MPPHTSLQLSTSQHDYPLDRFHQPILSLLILLILSHLLKHLIQVLLILSLLLLIDDLLQRVEMVIFEDIELEVLELLVAEWTAVVSCDGLLDAGSAVDMATAGYVAIVDGVQADRALELGLELLGADAEVVIVQVGLLLHNSLVIYKGRACEKSINKKE